MFYELIHTRCKQGIDLKTGKPRTDEGFKEYAYSSALVSGEVVDLPLLESFVRKPQTYDDPNYMEEAYLYFVPDVGASFMMNFHSISWDRDFDTKGQFSNRPGNFVNHVFAGDFSPLYPHELFGSSAWDAKAKDYAYYYETAPTDLPLRELSPVPLYSFAEIAAFIADGREALLKKAVAFLFAQYALPPEARKYLVIKDVSTENIQRWISAIFYAFSPKIAAGIPFATRMDQFATANRYMAKNPESAGQIKKFRTMIIGVDEADRKASCNKTHPDYILLDGKEKTFSFEANTTHPYFNLIASFSGTHQVFCRDFLQSFAVEKPGQDIFVLYDAFAVVTNPSLQLARALLNALQVLNKYQPSNTEHFHVLCKNMETVVPKLIGEDLISTLGIITWLQNASRLTGDSVASRLSEMVSNAFETLLFMQANMPEAEKFWQQMRPTEFAKDIALVMTDWQKINGSTDTLRQIAAADDVRFLSIYFDGAKVRQDVSIEEKKSIATFILHSCYQKGDAASLTKLIELMRDNISSDVANLLIPIAKDKITSDQKFAQSLLEYIVNCTSVDSNATMVALIDRFAKEGFPQFAAPVADKRFQGIRHFAEYGEFIETVCKLASISEDQWAHYVARVDKALDINVISKDAVTLAVQLLRLPAANNPCERALHVYALYVLLAKPRPSNLPDSLHTLVKRGFPKIEDATYINALTDALLAEPFNKEKQVCIFQILAQAPTKYFYEYVVKICMNPKKMKEQWNLLMTDIVKRNSGNINGIIVKALSGSKQSDRSINALAELLDEDRVYDYFYALIEKGGLVRPKKTKEPKKEAEAQGHTEKSAKRGWGWKK